jgi:hypothetical protein
MLPLAHHASCLVRVIGVRAMAGSGSIGGRRMDGERHRQQSGAIRVLPKVRPSVWYAVVGIALSITTVVLSALNAVSPQQSIAMAIPAVLATLSGLTRLVVGDAAIAWRRGFKQGCSVGLAYRPDDLTAALTAKARREVRLTRPAA